jgi:hypothetical protein
VRVGPDGAKAPPVSQPDLGYRANVPTYRAAAADPSEAVDRLVFEGWRAMTPVERLRLAACASAELARLAVAGLRLRYPDAREEELQRRAGALRLGRELTLQAFGPEAAAWLP